MEVTLETTGLDVFELLLEAREDEDGFLMSFAGVKGVLREDDAVVVEDVKD